MKSPTNEQKQDHQQPDQDHQLSEAEWQLVVQTMGDAPLRNMQHAATVDALIAKVMRHAGLVSDPPPKKTARGRRR